MAEVRHDVVLVDVELRRQGDVDVLIVAQHGPRGRQGFVIPCLAPFFRFRGVLVLVLEPIHFLVEDVDHLARLFVPVRRNLIGEEIQLAGNGPEIDFGVHEDPQLTQFSRSKFGEGR